MLAKMNRITKEIWGQAATALPFTLNGLKPFLWGPLAFGLWVRELNRMRVEQCLVLESMHMWCLALV